jgi:glycosyltransferase involved in cell wall biosynthesis
MKIPGFKGFFLNNRFLKKITKPGKYLKDFLVGMYVYYKYQNTPPTSSEKSIFLDIKNNVYNRYLYLFVKFLHLQGYSVIIQAHPVTLRYIRHFDQSFLIIKEKIATFSWIKPPGCQLYLSDSASTSKLTADYFSNLVLNYPAENDYYIPMSMHPRMYHEGWWNEKYVTTKRYRSVFFAGNADRGHYSISEKENVFSIIDRIQLYDLLVEQPCTFVPKTIEELEEKSADHQIVLVTKQRFMVPMARLRHVLANYSFFLACPGFVMPFSHNVIEAMSVGTIPIIQSNYAKLFQPPLQHGYDALLYENETSLLNQIDQALRLDEEQIARISKNALAYYEQYLTPKSVIQNLLKQEYNHIYLMAELPSVELLKKNIKKSTQPAPKLQSFSLPFVRS